MEYLSTLKLTTVDYFTLVVLLVSALVGISRGLFKEVLALASWFVASWVGKVNKVPIDVSVLVRDVLSVVSISVTIQIGVSISGEV